MCDNRLELIKEVFRRMPDAYKDFQKILTLAHRLRVGQNYKVWEEDVYILIASAAFKVLGNFLIRSQDRTEVMIRMEFAS